MLAGGSASADANYTNDYEWERGLAYEDSCLDGGGHFEEEDDCDHCYEDDDGNGHEQGGADGTEEAPPEIEEAQVAYDEAHISFIESKQQVAEIAKPR
eukprot:7321422-Pyramimonas_sp.AAC.1